MAIIQKPICDKKKKKEKKRILCQAAKILVIVTKSVRDAVNHVNNFIAKDLPSLGLISFALTQSYSYNEC